MAGEFNELFHTCAAWLMGTQTSGALPTVSPKNSGGATPITVTEALFREIPRPRTSARPPKALCQYL